MESRHGERLVSCEKVLVASLLRRDVMLALSMLPTQGPSECTVPKAVLHPPCFPAVLSRQNTCAPRCVLTDEFLRVEGSDSSIFVMNDVATTHTPLARQISMSVKSCACLAVLFLPMHTPPRCVLTDEFFRVEGSDGSIFVMGDAATIHTSLASEHVDELFESADTDKDGLLTVGQLQKLLHDAEKEFPHLAKHARFLDGKQNRCAPWL